MTDTIQQEHTRRETFRAALLAWFQENHRSFLWRETSDPWLILVCELLLKRTLAGRVNTFVPAFLEKYTGPWILAETDLNDLERDLAPLGLRKQRAAHFKALSKVLLVLQL
jgi:A/G-specific adenine glycosylase